MAAKVTWLVTTLSASLLLLQLCAAIQWCSQAGNAECSGNLCCSQYGYCGSSLDYCGAGCQSGPCDPWLPASNPSPPPSGDGSTGEASYYTAPFVPTECVTVTMKTSFLQTSTLPQAETENPTSGPTVGTVENGSAFSAREMAVQAQTPSL
ncbi:hypothetical protein R1flu_023058 [Riccia fluitans]|uniref:Chitin-binding type-1 domain-containing protein n=1 Tax=Riccia fluitans TaxID=41844 RepID=A0ABD1XTZ3_9MARC